jgi:hypothetical protein
MKGLIIGCLTLLGLLKPATSLAEYEIQLVCQNEVDLIELNHYFDLKGRKVFSQLIFWRWDVECDDYVVIDWKLYKHPSQTPRKNWESNRFEVIWIDGDYLRRVIARQSATTYTYFDPEVTNRCLHPPEFRKRLACFRRTKE